MMPLCNFHVFYNPNFSKQYYSVFRSKIRHKPEKKLSISGPKIKITNLNHKISEQKCIYSYLHICIDFHRLSSMVSLKVFDSALILARPQSSAHLVDFVPSKSLYLKKPISMQVKNMTHIIHIPLLLRRKIIFQYMSRGQAKPLVSLFFEVELILFKRMWSRGRVM